MNGSAIRVRFLPDLTVSRGKLHSGGSSGTAVHAAGFPRRRELVLESALLADGPELARIAVHELSHFIWFRLGNPHRGSWEALLRAESGAGARGELGWSSELIKNKLASNHVRLRNKKWREYCCESFCDTAAWLYAGLSHHSEWTLATRFRRDRAQWFQQLTSRRSLLV